MALPSLKTLEYVRNLGRSVEDALAHLVARLATPACYKIPVVDLFEEELRAERSGRPSDLLYFSIRRKAFRELKGYDKLVFIRLSDRWIALPVEYLDAYRSCWGEPEEYEILSREELEQRWRKHCRKHKYILPICG